MKESVTYQATLEEGRAEGVLQEARKMLLGLGRKLLGPPPADVVAALQAISDVHNLEELHARLPDVSSWPALMRLPVRRRPRKA